jgi:ribose transport system substrate-binding protein
VADSTQPLDAPEVTFRMKTSSRVLSLIAATGILFSACSSSAATPVPATSAPASSAPASVAPASAAPASVAPASVAPSAAAFGCTSPAGFAPVWYASAAHPFFETVKPGVEAAAKEFSFTATEQIGPDWTQDAENQGLEALFAKGSKYFSVYPSDASGANALYKELTSKGATIMNFGASTLQPTTASLVFATDVKAAAMQATEALIQQMGDKGNIINVLEVLTDPNTALRKAGVEEVVAKHPNVKIIQEIAGMATQQDAVQKVTDAIAANSNTVDGIIATGLTPTVAIAQVMTDYKAKGGTRTIHSVGIDTDPTVVKAISDGVMDGTISQNPYGQGYLSMLALMCMADGYKVKAGVYAIDTGTAFVTKANLATYADDIAKVTAKIKASMLTDILTK